MLTNKDSADISVANAVRDAAKNQPLDEPQPTPKPSRFACQRAKPRSKNWVVLETIAPTLPYLTAAHMAHSWVGRLLLTSNLYTLIQFRILLEIS